MTLWLEQLYLTEEVTHQHLKADTATPSKSLHNGDGLADANKAQDVWEKRQLKVVRKLRV